MVSPWNMASQTGNRTSEYYRIHERNFIMRFSVKVGKSLKNLHSHEKQFHGVHEVPNRLWTYVGTTAEAKP